MHIKCECIIGSILDGCRQPIFYSFNLNKPHGCKVFCKPETIHANKINNSFLNIIVIYLEGDNKENVNFNGETLTFILQIVKI